MSGTDDFSSGSESSIRPIESTIMKSEWDHADTSNVKKTGRSWDHVDTGDLDKQSKNSKDWVDDLEVESQEDITHTVHSRTMYDETQHLSRLQSYVTSATRRDKIRMDHEIKATTPSRVPADKLGAYLYGCSSREVLSSDVDRGCMLSCLQGYRPEDVDACNHDVYMLEENILRKVYSANDKTKSETSYIYTVLTDKNVVKDKLSKLDNVPSAYKVFTTNPGGSSAKFLYLQLADTVTRDVVVERESCPPPPPPQPNTNSTMFWTWLLIIIVGILAVLGIIWLISYFMKQPSSTTIVKETVVVTSESDMFGSGTPISTGPRKPYSY